jgi:hypothetical protein
MKIKLTQIDLEKYLTVLNPYKQGKQLRCKCPKCNGDEFYISLEKDENPFRCWRENNCGYKGNIYTLLFDLGKFEDLDLNFKVKHYKDEIKNSFDIILEDEEFLPEEIKLPIGYKRIYKNKYLESRGFNDEMFEKFECGKTIIGKLQNYIIFPIYFFNVNIGYIARTEKTKEYCEKNNLLRYYKPSNVDFTKIFYEIRNENLENVIIVEGIFDKFVIDNFIESKNIKNTFCVASLSVGIGFNQVKILKLLGVKNIIFFYDKDVIKKTILIALKLFYIFTNVSITFVESKDPGDSNFDEIEYALNNLKNPINFSNEIIVNKVK